MSSAPRKGARRSDMILRTIAFPSAFFFYRSFYRPFFFSGKAGREGKGGIGIGDEMTWDGRGVGFSRTLT